MISSWAGFPGCSNRERDRVACIHLPQSIRREQHRGPSPMRLRRYTRGRAFRASQLPSLSVRCPDSTPTPRVVRDACLRGSSSTSTGAACTDGATPERMHPLPACPRSQMATLSSASRPSRARRWHRAQPPSPASCTRVSAANGMSPQLIWFPSLGSRGLPSVE